MLQPLQILPRPSPVDVPPTLDEFLKQLRRPTWFDCPGQLPGPPRVVVALLHGNEPSGASAIHAWLRSDNPPRRPTALIVASVNTALTPPHFSHRMLDGEPDANRSFRPPFDGPVGRAALDLLERLERAGPEAMVDLHNNTGHSPAYGVGAGITRAQLNLTSLFASRYMQSNLSLGTLVEATCQRFPSVTVECGKAHDPLADATALAGLERFLTATDLRLDAPPSEGLEVLGRPVRVTVRSTLSLGLSRDPDSNYDVTLHPQIDRFNFEPLGAGAAIGWTRCTTMPLSARGADGSELAEELFARVEGRLVTRRPMVPIMMTLDVQAARSDCLFYAMLDASSAADALDRAPGVPGG